MGSPREFDEQDMNRRTPSRRATGTCKATGCSRKISVRGYCNIHYQKMHRWGNIHGKKSKCEVCGKTFFVKSGRQKTCSNACSKQLKEQRLADFRSTQLSVKKQRDCLICGKSFMAKTSQVTCSQACRDLHLHEYETRRARERRKTPRAVPCEWCGKTFVPVTHAKTCSAACRALFTKAKRAAKGQLLIERKCKVCGTKFRVGVLNNRTITCSAKCRGIRAHEKQKESYLARKTSRRGQALRAENLKMRFRLTQEDYTRMLTAQRGKCAICGTSEPGTSGVFAVDHDHRTGRIRGLLCRSCNVGIGNLRDEPTLLQAALKYLEQRHQEDTEL
jgi:predicted nucleic acid-binding Zn ribbon protein